MYMHPVIDLDPERIIRIKKKWWRLYIAELVRLVIIARRDLLT
jgi:hypothetical protein